MKLQDLPRVYLDIETTGLDPRIHEIIEIGAVRDDDFSLEVKIQPNLINADPIALQINGYSETKWKNAKSSKLILPLTLPFFQNCILIGQNISFDVSFLMESYQKLGITWECKYKIDLITLAYEHLVPDGLNSFSLASICHFLHIPLEENPHRALNGARKVQEVFHILNKYGK